MASITATSLSQGASTRNDRRPGLFHEIRTILREFSGAAFNPYRPELHYMRGPGPAWHKKQSAASIQDPA